MPYPRPTLSDLITRIANDLGSRVLGAGSALRRSTLGIIGYVMAGAVYLLYGYINWVYLQLFPDTAEGAQLARWASIWGLTPGAATAAIGPISLVGSVNGADIPLGTLIVRQDGATFLTVADVQIAAGVASVNARAQTAGSAGNTNAGVTMSLQSPIAGVNSVVTVAAGGIVGGNDQEDDASLLSRLLSRIQNPPQGGDSNDYIQWVQTALPGIATRVWCLPASYGLGTVGITFVEDNNVVSIIPNGGDITTAQNYINTVRPVTAQPTVFACIADALALSIHLVAAAGYTLAAAEANVQAALNDMAAQACGPGGTTSATLLVSQINDAIGLAAGVGDYTLTQVNGIAPATVTTAAGHIITSVAITWV